ncbi:MAG: Na(+)/H(+)-K(+) antiporter GerN [Candidatus Omnitrophica bacterium]|nr:Na(+)/H(+)-K(+) antiporter GerN [Candidatus Omnitrophota bacterium]
MNLDPTAAITIDPLTLSRFFLAVLLLLLSALVCGNLFQRLTIPKVVGEIAGGLFLGPTLLGRVLPGAYEEIFMRQGELISAVYWLGLVLLMFCSGFEIETGLDRRDKRVILGLVIGTTVVPALFGWISTYFFDLDRLMGPAGDTLALRLIITVALAVTSIPVLSKIFMDLGILRTTFAKITLATATIHDLVLWVFVSIAAGLVSSERAQSFADISMHVVISVLFFFTALVVMPRCIRWIDARPGLRSLPKNNELAVIVLVLLVFTVLAGWLDVNLVFGAFLAGIVVNGVKHPSFEEARRHIKSFSTAFFVPVYFAVVGLKIDLFRDLDAGFVTLFTLYAMLVQTVAVLVTARWLRYDWLSSANLAFALNDRGGPCIVLATLALDLGIISREFFVTLVALAILTSLTAGWWLRYVLRRGWPLLNG